MKMKDSSPVDKVFNLNIINECLEWSEKRWGLESESKPDIQEYHSIMKICPIIDLQH